jgi:hypothetical protein
VPLLMRNTEAAREENDDALLEKVPSSGGTRPVMAGAPGFCSVRLGQEQGRMRPCRAARAVRPLLLLEIDVPDHSSG